jgi:hypothetical protein
MSTVAPVLRTLASFGRVSLLGFTAILTGLVVVVGLATHRWGELDHSVWVIAGAPVTIYLFVLGIMASAMLLSPLVAHGVTRRTFAAASGVATLALAVAAGLYMVAGFLAERAAYAAVGGAAELQEPHLFDATGQLHLVFAEYSLLAAANLVAGWLIGIGYQRFGWLGGTLCVLPALLPVAAVELALGVGSAELPRPAAEVPVGAGLPLATAAVALGLLAGRWLVHAVPVRARKS